MDIELLIIVEHSVMGETHRRSAPYRKNPLRTVQTFFEQPPVSTDLGFPYALPRN